MNKYKYPHARITIFAKAPIAGQVKTRMQPELSPEQSAQLQTLLLQNICKTVFDAGLCETELWCSPNTGHSIFESMQNTYNLSLHKQSEGHLGDKIKNCFYDNQKTSLILGTDCPYLQAEHLDQLLSRLEKGADLSIIPALDGGYVALACKGEHLQIFDDIDWGTDKVFQQTLDKAQANNLETSILEALSDIDFYPDYLELCKKRPEFEDLQ